MKNKTLFIVTTISSFLIESKLKALFKQQKKKMNSTSDIKRENISN